MGYNFFNFTAHERFCLKTVENKHNGQMGYGGGLTIYTRNKVTNCIYKSKKKSGIFIIWAL